MKAAILILTETGEFDEVVNELKKIAGVKHAFAVAGGADVAALVEAPDLKGLSNIALKVHRTPGVTASETLVEVQRG